MFLYEYIVNDLLSLFERSLMMVSQMNDHYLEER